MKKKQEVAKEFLIRYSKSIKKTNNNNKTTTKKPPSFMKKQNIANEE